MFLVGKHDGFHGWVPIPIFDRPHTRPAVMQDFMVVPIIVSLIKILLFGFVRAPHFILIVRSSAGISNA